MERYVGDLEGKIITDWNELENDRTVETDSEILGRAKAFFEMAKQTNYDSILVVGHNGFLKSLRLVILGNSGGVDFDAGDMRNCDFEIFEIWPELQDISHSIYNRIEFLICCDKNAFTI